MDDTIYLLFFPLALLAGSIYELYASVIERKVKYSGQSTEAKVIKVERVIPSGLGSLFHKKNGTIECDYLLQLSYTNLVGKKMQISTTVAARMKVVEGVRFSFFSEGDTILIRYSEKYPRNVVIFLESIKQRQGNVFPIVLWTFCAVLLAAILVTTLVFL